MSAGETRFGRKLETGKWRLLLLTGNIVLRTTIGQLLHTIPPSPLYMVTKSPSIPFGSQSVTERRGRRSSISFIPEPSQESESFVAYIECEK